MGPSITHVSVFDSPFLAFTTQVGSLHQKLSRSFDVEHRHTKLILLLFINMICHSKSASSCNEASDVPRDLMSIPQTCSSPFSAVAPSPA